nr:structural maintenance of chromosomes protein 4 [Quercus suber]
MRLSDMVTISKQRWVAVSFSGSIIVLLLIDTDHTGFLFTIVMSTQSPQRPSRRAISRRKIVVDDDGSDIENTNVSVDTRDEEEEFTPAPARSSRTSPRRKTHVEPDTPRRRTTAATRRTRPADLMEPSQILSPPESVRDEPLSPTKKSPPKRRSAKDARTVRKSRVSRVSIASDATDLAPPTPQATASPEPQTLRSGTPLSDITESTVNEQTPTATARYTTPMEDVEMTGMESDLTPESIVDKLDQETTPRPAGNVESRDPHVEPPKLGKPVEIAIRPHAAEVVQLQESIEAKPRMTITYLVLTNFKSYAGRQEVGPFHASFSSVVGPNGSGKSNVIDSLLFVFGFRASKMRQGKISALIHNSAAFPDLDHCEVEVHFQEVMDLHAGGTEVVPSSQLIISRRAFKNNSSKYYMNGRESSFTTVTTLLKAKGVDLDHKRFLILQGEVESIAQMKPKAPNEHEDGLLEYLEDIIGTSKYKAPIEEASKEQETLNEICLEKSNRVQHVEKEKNGLEDKRAKALAFIKNENELVLQKSALWQLKWLQCADTIQVAEEARARTQALLDEESEKHKGNEHERKRIEKQYTASSKEFEKLEQTTQAILKEQDKHDKESVKFEEKRKHLNNKAKKLGKTFESSKFGIHECETLFTQADEDLTRIAGQIETLEEEKVEEEKELVKVRDSLKGKTQGLSDSIAAKQRQLEPWSAKVHEKQSAMAVAQSELDMLLESENAGALAVTEIEAKISSFVELQQQRQSELKDRQAQRKSAEKNMTPLEKQLELLLAKEAPMKTKLLSSRSKADEARASLSATQSQGNVLAGLTRLKESGRIDGFHGRLGNLGAIDQKYDVAISTACPSLDNLVVDTVEVGQQCIDHLRKNNLGRANFILLDRLPQRDLSVIETPEDVPRLFDLVKSKYDRLLPAFYSVLQNTLVAKDLEQANRIAYGTKRWRVVTLDGQLIDKSGTMSGGGTRIAKGGMSSKLAADTTKEQVARLEVDRDALEKEYTELQENIKVCRTQLNDCEALIPALDTQASKLTLELESTIRNIADARRRVEELTAAAQSSTSDTNKVSRLEKGIEKMQSEIGKLQSESAGIEDDIKQLQDKIMEVGGIRLRTQKGKVDGLNEQIDTLSEQINATETSKAKAQKQLTKHQKDNNDASKELEKVNAELESLEEEVKSQSRNTSDSKREAERAEQALEDKKEELQSLKAELDEQTAMANEIRGIELELRNDLEDKQKILTDIGRKQAHWEEQISKLTLQHISDDGEEKEPEPVPEISRDELLDIDVDDLNATIVKLEEATSQHVELSVLAEYRRRVNEFNDKSADLSTALATRDAVKKRLKEMQELRHDGFMEGLGIISRKLKEMYQLITMGGNAELELADSMDPFDGGVNFSVMPPKKSWKNISNLSGGEKTLSSLALVFALHHYKPTPLYVMDEIDAALDFRNVSIVAAYIKERTKNAQFIVISLRNNMFELASRLVGVYKVNHMTGEERKHLKRVSYNKWHELHNIRKEAPWYPEASDVEARRTQVDAGARTTPRRTPDCAAGIVVHKALQSCSRAAARGKPICLAPSLAFVDIWFRREQVSCHIYSVGHAPQ